MHFKLIVVMVEDQHTNEILAAARAEGATGATVLNQARGEGLSPTKTFLGLSIGNQVDVILMLVEEHLSRQVLERIAAVGEFDETSGTGIAFQVDVEDAIGVRHQIEALEGTVEDMI
jgi:uncharacterized protein YaaQ